jgi:Hypothetical glycosyl hydrolase family 15
MSFFAIAFLLTTPQILTATWHFPPTAPVHHNRPLLVNYCQILGPDTHIPNLPQRLAQWDVLILAPDVVLSHHLSLSDIRKTNPNIKILAWVPLQSPSDPRLKAMIPANAANLWGSRDAAGKLIIASWGDPIFNPWANHFAWPKAVKAYIEKYCLDPAAGYDGVMLDCLAEIPWGGSVDVDRDGKAMTPADTLAWQAGMSDLLSNLKREFPDAILTGNGGNPWSSKCPYFQWASGVMNENVLGNEWRDQTWQYCWDGIAATLTHVKDRPPFHFLQVDIRRERSQAQCAAASSLTPDDLRRFRLGLTTALLRDHTYFGFDRGDCLHGQLWWFDEYDADLGDPIAPFDQNKFANNTFSREFQNGMVICNPSIAAVTVTLKKIARDISTKQSGRIFVVPPSDGRIFVYSVGN